MANIKKGDNVQVITGSDKGKQGQVLAVLTEANKVIVQGVNLKKKHNRITQSDRGVKQGGIETIEAPIHVPCERTSHAVWMAFSARFPFDTFS